MSKLRNGLTKKQDGFVRDVLRPKISGAQAILNNYDTTDIVTARSMATENLTKPAIRNAIQAELDRLAGLGLKITAEAIEAGIVEISQKGHNADTLRLKAFELLAEIKKMKSNNLVLDTSAARLADRSRDLTKLSDDELLDELTKRISLSIVPGVPGTRVDPGTTSIPVQVDTLQRDTESCTSSTDRAQ